MQGCKYKKRIKHSWQDMPARLKDMIYDMMNDLHWKTGRQAADLI